MDLVYHNGYSISTAVTIPLDEHQALLRYCQATGEAPGQVVATLLREYLDKKKFFKEEVKTGGKPI